MTSTGDFGRVAELYARTRPDYLPEVLDDLIALGDLPAGGRVLEIGPATGQATVPLARRGYHITAIEPDAALVAQAQKLLGPGQEVDFHVSTFEAWPLPEERFDLVLAATSFHWIDPAVRYVKSAAALKPGRALAVINTHHVSGGTSAFFEAVQACYAEHMPANAPARALRSANTIPPDTAALIQSGLYQEPDVRRYEWQAAYTAGEYTDLLSTYSDHIALDEETRDALFAGISSLIESEFGGEIYKQYLTELIVARRRS